MTELRFRIFDYSTCASLTKKVEETEKVKIKQKMKERKPKWVQKVHLDPKSIKICSICSKFCINFIKSSKSPKIATKIAENRQSPSIMPFIYILCENVLCLPCTVCPVVCSVSVEPPPPEWPLVPLTVGERVFALAVQPGLEQGGKPP